MLIPYKQFFYVDKINHFVNFSKTSIFSTASKIAVFIICALAKTTTAVIIIIFTKTTIFTIVITT